MTDHMGLRLTSRSGSPLAWLRSPANQTDLIQISKTVLAAVVAWLLAVEVFDLAQPFLAPWTALLTVHATVYRTFWRGAQSVSATVLGIGLSVLAVAVAGNGVVALALALLIGLLVSRIKPLREEGVAVATTALFVLTTGYEQQAQQLGERFLDVALGVTIGVLVNLLVLPPLNDRSARMLVDQVNREMGGLMRRMAQELRSDFGPELSGEWIEATRDMDRHLDDAWALVGHARESSWWNPRRLTGRATAEHDTTLEDVLRRLEDGVAQLRTIARTVNESTRSAHGWDERFRDPWVGLLDDLGRRITEPDQEVAGVRTRLDTLTRDLSVEDLPGLYWPLYGALITALRNVIDVVDDTASRSDVRT